MSSAHRRHRPHRRLANLRRSRDQRRTVWISSKIARNLFVSESTVKTHVARVFTKLGLRDRAQAVIYGYETGLVAPGGRSATTE